MNKKLVVCHILNELLPSGAETMLVNSASEWINCELHVVGTQKELGSYCVQFEKAGYTVHHIYNDSFFLQHCEFRKFLRQLKPDVVHVHREGQDYLYEFDARVAGVKHIVRTVHNVFAFTGILRARRIVTRGIGRLVGTKFIAIGQSVYDNEKERFFNRPYELINNWCDENRFVFTQGEPSEGIMNIVSVGNCSQVKNHLFILKGVEYLINNGSNKIHYYHIGSGKIENEEKKFVQNFKLQDYVTFVGRTDPLPYLKKAHLFSMPSTYEGVGIAALEAMCMGIPCLLTYVEGLKDFKAIQSRDIYFCDLEQENFNKTLKLIYEKYDNGELNHSKDLADKVIQKYSMKKSVKKYIDVYQK